MVDSEIANGLTKAELEIHGAVKRTHRDLQAEGSRILNTKEAKATRSFFI